MTREEAVEAGARAIFPAACEWADPGERVWGLVPVEVPA